MCVICNLYLLVISRDCSLSVKRMLNLTFLAIIIYCILSVETWLRGNIEILSLSLSFSGCGCSVAVWDWMIVVGSMEGWEETRREQEECGPWPHTQE